MSGEPNENWTVRVSGLSVSQLPSWQDWPTPQVIPFALFGWVQCPLPSQRFLVQGLPSSGQAVPASVLRLTQRPAVQVACLQRLAGLVQPTLAEQLHLPLVRHLPLAHWVGLLQTAPPRRLPAAASRAPRTSAPTAAPARPRRVCRRDRGWPKVRTSPSKRFESIPIRSVH